MDFIKETFNKGFGFLTKPSESFDSVKNAKFGDGLKHMLVLLAVTAILGSIITSFTASTYMTMFAPEAAGIVGGPFIFVTMLITTYIGTTVALLIWGLWLHLWVYLLGTKKGLEGTFKSVFYGGTPSYLLGWIPMINFLAFIWTLVLQGMGLMKLQGMTSGKAALAIIIALVIPAVIGVAVMATLFTALFMTMGGVPGTAMPTIPY